MGFNRGLGRCQAHSEGRRGCRCGKGRRLRLDHNIAGVGVDDANFIALGPRGCVRGESGFGANLASLVGIDGKEDGFTFHFGKSYLDKWSIGFFIAGNKRDRSSCKKQE
ncbi:MAG: hypothetical protein J5658_04610 [Prevotella sp.]|nr:hypothetical protein [Prevotella sp.]